MAWTVETGREHVFWIMMSSQDWIVIKTDKFSARIDFDKAY